MGLAGSPDSPWNWESFSYRTKEEGALDTKIQKTIELGILGRLARHKDTPNIITLITSVDVNAPNFEKDSPHYIKSHYSFYDFQKKIWCKL